MCKQSTTQINTSHRSSRLNILCHTIWGLIGLSVCLLSLLFFVPQSNFPQLNSITPPLSPNNLPNSTYLSNKTKHKQINLTTIGQTPTLNQPFTFKDISISAGLNHSHSQHTGKITDLMDSLTAGACAADFNNDGWIDLVFAAGGGHTRYYGNKAWWNQHKNIVIYQNINGQLSNKTATSGLDITASTTACLSVDFNNDGLTDILIASTHQDYLFQNKGQFRFELIPEFSQVADQKWTSHISTVDLNQDGLLDIHLSHFIAYQKNQKNLENATGFSQQHKRQFEPGAFDGLANQILINQGNFKFIDKTTEMLNNKHAERTLSANWLDLNFDGLLDLIEFNLSDQPIRTYLQLKKGQLTEFNPKDWPLLINDTHFASLSKQLNDQQDLLILTRPQGMSNIALALNLTQQDIAWQSGLNQSNFLYLNRWGITLTDFNNDGLTDFSTATGGYMPDPFTHQTSLASPNLCGAQQRQPITNTVKPFQFTLFPCSTGTVQSSRGVMQLDINNDGKQDLLFSNNNDFPQLLLNTSDNNNNWITLSINDLPTWQGGQIHIQDGKAKLKQMIQLKQGLFGNQDPRFHFGLATAENVDIKIISADKSKQVSAKLSANQIYQLSSQESNWQISPLAFTTQANEAATSAQNLINAAPDIATALRLFQRQTMTQDSLLQFERRLKLANTIEKRELADLIQSHSNAEHLAFYLTLLNSTDLHLSSSAAKAIQTLELELSVNPLLAQLDKQSKINSKQTGAGVAITTNQTELNHPFCQVSDIFATWFDQEEAVTRAKYKAVPYLFKALNSNDAHTVICAAKALGNAEHANASSAILAVLTNAPATVQIELINALGKIRQTEANSSIKKLMLAQVTTNSTTQLPTDNQDIHRNKVSIIQQGLIALTRLDDKSLDLIIKQLSQDNNLRAYLFTALVNLPQVKDGIVISTEQNQLWLNPLLNQLEYSQLRFIDAKIAYLHLQQQNKVTKVALFPLLNDLNKTTNGNITPLKQTIILLILHQAKQNGTNLNPTQIEALLSSPLNTHHLTLLAQQLSSSQFQNLNVTQLTAQQQANLLISINKLTQPAQIKLLQILEQNPHKLTNEVIQAWLMKCITNPINKQIIKPTNPQTTFGTAQLACQILSLAQQDASNTLKQTLNQTAQVLSPEQQLLFSQYIHQTLQLSNNKMAINRISAHLLNQTSVEHSVKKHWALANYINDKYSVAWLKMCIKQGDEPLINQLLTQTKNVNFIQLNDQFNLVKLTQNPLYSNQIRQRLNGFYQESYGSLKTQINDNEIRASSL